MAKIVWSVPLLQYGKFLIEATPEELGVDIGSPHSMAMAYAVYAQLAAKGYDEGLKIDVDTFISKPGHVTGQYQESSEKEPRSDHHHVYTWADDGNGHEGSFCECGQEESGRGPEQAEALIKDRLGATTVEPWTKTPAPSTTPKAWDIDV